MAGAGTTLYFDGRTSAAQPVTVALGDNALAIVDAAGQPVAVWPYAEITGHAPADRPMRLGWRRSPVPARLAISDAELAAAIAQRAPGVDRDGVLGRRQRRQAILLGMAAMATLIAVAVVGVPLLAGRIAPYVPLSVERKLGVAVNAQLRGMLDTAKLGERFECGRAPSEQPGRAVLQQLIERLRREAAISEPLTISVVRRPEANAIALPGLQIYVFEGLISTANSPDEVAGVIAHEIGHIVHRDGTKALLQSAGLSILFGMLLGDFVGGGAVVVAARTVLQSTYSRDAEAAADMFGAKLMAKSGGDPRALGTILARIGGATEPGMKILLDHPETRARIDAINRVVPAKNPIPLLQRSEWIALKAICTGA